MSQQTRISAATYRAMVAAAEAGTKKKKPGGGSTNRRVMNATKDVARDGTPFDSRRERRRYEDLLIRRELGEIEDLRLQVKVPLFGRDGPLLTPTGRQMVWIADFVWTEVKSGRRIYADAKGHPTDTYKMKKAVLAAQGIEVVEL